MRIPELRLNDYADVLAIESCPAILNGPGEVVTATYHTDRADVIDLQFSGLKDPLGATPSHPFWSVSRPTFIPAGELVLGEKVVALDGQTFRLTSITPRAGPEPVFNLEVANQHTYYVSSDGLLVHNAKQGGIYLGDMIDRATGKRIGKATKPPPNIQRSAKAKGPVNGATGANIAGSKVHANYSPGKNYATDREATKLTVKTKRGTKTFYADAIDFENKIIRELKPYSARNVARATKQLEKYIKILERDWGKGWRGYIDFYK